MTIHHAYFDLTPQSEGFFKLDSLEFRMNGIRGHLSLLFKGDVKLGKRSDRITCAPNTALCFQTKCMEVSCHVKQLLPRTVRQGQVLQFNIHDHEHARIPKCIKRVEERGRTCLSCGYQSMLGGGWRCRFMIKSSCLVSRLH